MPGAAALPAELVAAIERHASFDDVPPGTVIVRQHQLMRDLFVLVNGRIATLVDFTDVGDLVVETTEDRGRIFGWSGLRQPRRATATVRAEGPCQVMTCPIDPLISASPRWEAALCELVAADLADRTRDMAGRWSTPGAGGGDA